MRLSQLFVRTLRQAPAEAETASHQLLLRAGLIQQLAAGVYSYLPPAWRALRKIENIIRYDHGHCVGPGRPPLPTLRQRLRHDTRR